MRSALRARRPLGRVVPRTLVREVVDVKFVSVQGGGARLSCKRLVGGMRHVWIRVTSQSCARASNRHGWREKAISSPVGGYHNPTSMPASSTTFPPLWPSSHPSVTIQDGINP